MKAKALLAWMCIYWSLILISVIIGHIVVPQGYDSLWMSVFVGITNVVIAFITASNLTRERFKKTKGGN